MGEEKTKFIINNPDGTKDKVEEIISFEFSDTSKKYVVYTKNEKDENGNVTIYVTEVIKDDKGVHFKGVSSDSEWRRIKSTLRELIKDNK